MQWSRLRSSWWVCLRSLGCFLCQAPRCPVFDLVHVVRDIQCWDSITMLIEIIKIVLMYWGCRMYWACRRGLIAVRIRGPNNARTVCLDVWEYWWHVWLGLCLFLQLFVFVYDVLFKMPPTFLNLKLPYPLRPIPIWPGSWWICCRTKRQATLLPRRSWNQLDRRPQPVSVATAAPLSRLARSPPTHPRPHLRAWLQLREVQYALKLFLQWQKPLSQLSLNPGKEGGCSHNRNCTGASPEKDLPETKERLVDRAGGRAPPVEERGRS